MTLDEFVKLMKLDVDNFKSEWVLNRSSDPNLYPMEMDEADWYEQFVAHIQMIGE
jgi:hypothetical protein